MVRSAAWPPPDGKRFRVHSSAVERRIADPEVAGSIPVVPFFKFCFCVNATAFQRRNGMRPAVCAHGALV